MNSYQLSALSGQHSETGDRRPETVSLQPSAFSLQSAARCLLPTAPSTLLRTCFLLFTFYLLLLTSTPAFSQEDDFGAENFMEAAQADDAQITREKIRNAILRMSNGIRAGKEEQVNRAVERRAQRIENPEIKALLYFTLSEAYEANGKKKAALLYLDKALASSAKRKPFYQKKKDELLRTRP